MAGLFGAESPTYLGAGQNPAGADRGGLLGMFPGTPKYEQPTAPAQAPTPGPTQPNGKTIQIRIAMPGVLAFECALTPEVLAALTSVGTQLLRTLAESLAHPAQPEEPANDEAPAAPSSTEERRVSETQERVWERE